MTSRSPRKLRKKQIFGPDAEKTMNVAVEDKMRGDYRQDLRFPLMPYQKLVCLATTPERR